MVLRAGEVEQVGSFETLCDDPACLFVAGFIGSPRMNLKAGEQVRIGYRPDRVLAFGPDETRFRAAA